MRDTKEYLSLPYNPKLKERARALRKAGNLAEVLLWNQLKRGLFLGLDFDRQKIIGNYITDFYCAEKRVVVEVDGSSHDDKADYDAQRDAFLSSLGLQVIHIRDADVKENLDAVLDGLRQQLTSAQTTPRLRRTPPKEGNFATTLQQFPSLGGVPRSGGVVCLPSGRVFHFHEGSA